MFIQGPEPGVHISLDDFSISLPDPSSFLDPDDFCGELLPNGNAEGNGYNPYPFRNWRSDEKILVRDENGNKFFRLEKRNRYYSSMTSDVAVKCFDRGVSYLASFNIRIHSEYSEEYYVVIKTSEKMGVGLTGRF